MSYFVPLSEGECFESGDDTGRLIVSGDDSMGRYSMLEWTVAAGKELGTDEVMDYGPHCHHGCEETFLIQDGSLEFLIGEDVVTMQTGDFVRVPPGVKHGYQNISGAPVKMLVTFTPGGFESLFLKYRTDRTGTTGDGFVADAIKFYQSEFDLPHPKLIDS